MIKTTYAEVSSTNTLMALQKLRSIQVGGKVAYQIKKILDELDKVLKQARIDFRAQVVDKYGTSEQTAEDQKLPHGFKLREDVTEQEVDQAIDTFGKNEVTIDREKIPLSGLGDNKFSAQDILSLEFILSDL